MSLMRTCAAGGWNMGRLSQTKYCLSDPTSTTTVVRRHHPLCGQKLELLFCGGKRTVTVRLHDGSSMKLPRRWTDLDAPPCQELGGDSRVCLKGLCELLSVFASVSARARGETSIAAEQIMSAHPSVETSDDQAKAVGVSRTTGPRIGVGEASRASPSGGDAALRTVDESHIGAANCGAENGSGGG